MYIYVCVCVCLCTYVCMYVFMCGPPLQNWSLVDTL